MSWDSASTWCVWLSFEGEPLNKLSSGESLTFVYTLLGLPPAHAPTRPRLAPLPPPLYIRGGPSRNDAEALGQKQPP